VIAEGEKTPHTHPAPYTETVIAGGGWEGMEIIIRVWMENMINYVKQGVGDHGKTAKSTRISVLPENKLAKNTRASA
jgi:hypothetical protein